MTGLGVCFARAPLRRGGGGCWLVTCCCRGRERSCVRIRVLTAPAERSEHHSLRMEQASKQEMAEIVHETFHRRRWSQLRSARDQIPQLDAIQINQQIEMPSSARGYVMTTHNDTKDELNPHHRDFYSKS
eukprot:2781371-Pleurochrysis_carterae.AAC.1